ncbi:MAG: hypothetical protein KDA24_17780 [Deltaproteobacteria bacterium]|nr:hypothetical protein [Deltaproteobacteria bacterium]
MRHATTLSLASLLALILPSCVVLDDPDWMDDDDDVTDDDDTANDDDDEGPCDGDPSTWDLDPPAEWDVAASFVLPNGDPVQDLMITLCGTSCYNEPTNCDGVVYFPFAEDDDYVIEPLFAIDLEFDKWARSYDFVTYSGTQIDITSTPFTVPSVEEIEPIGTGEVERTFASGLEVSFNADDVELPFGPDVGTLGVVEIPPERHPTGGLLGWTPVRVWATAVWEMEIEEPEGFQVVAPLTQALPEGAEVTWLVAHYDYGIVEGSFEVFPAELSQDRMSMRTPAGQGIDRATMWIAAMRMPADG